jgi:hypothetical protein
MTNRICQCKKENGAHDLYCTTNNEYDMYVCIGCGELTFQYTMAEGKCVSCRKQDGSPFVQMEMTRYDYSRMGELQFGLGRFK